MKQFVSPEDFFVNSTVGFSADGRTLVLVNTSGRYTTFSVDSGGTIVPGTPIENFRSFGYRNAVECGLLSEGEAETMCAEANDLLCVPNDVVHTAAIDVAINLLAGIPYGGPAAEDLRLAKEYFTRGNR